ncbi:MAG TPA: RraA family protein [Rubrobacter sp.]|nr:RraA family protein [Rubrobacter sp.]
MNHEHSSEALFEMIRRELYTAVVGDVMDSIGFRHQFLPPQIKPLSNDMIVVGRSMPVLEADVFAEAHDDASNSVMSRPFGLMLQALDDLRPDEVYVCTGASLEYALWGELMSTRAITLGAAGAVVDGYSRDTRGILQLGFPTFSYGGYAQDQGPRGKVIDFRVPLEIGGVRLEPGDLLFGDLDGVCLIPREAEEEVVRKALEKAREESVLERALREGMSATEAFARHGIM